MIAKEVVENLINESIKDTDIFLVDIKISTSNLINVLIDKIGGVSIEDCIHVSRGVEFNLDRDKEDFELQVSSPGLSEPLKVFKQYEKNIGKVVKIYTYDGKKHEGELVEVDEEGATIFYEEKERLEGKKKKILVEKREKYLFETDDDSLRIRETKIVISFK